ncbi:GAF and ANTAR domain-containing protein [Streptomyces racemochromogenes]|uniref:GAF and ANTAR domain-containing protein n=1 Tax=Streptomyces racemochromogenes TaxID=67353 RepID=A0ABW7PFG4_9ACTN
MTSAKPTRDRKQATEMTREQQLARAFVSLADTLAPGFDPLSLFDGLVRHCVGLLDADAGGVMMGDARGGLRIMAASGEDAVLLELLQLQTGSGPCLDCYHSGLPLSVPDLAADRHRWPELATAALEVGYRSTQTVPLRLHEQVIGALTLFRRAEGRLDAEQTEVAQALADSAALSLLHWSADPDPGAEVLTKTQAAIAYKNALEMAKGMIAQHAGVSVEEASALLRGYTIDRGVSLADTVHALVAGSLDLGRITALPRRP